MNKGKMDKIKYNHSALFLKFCAKKINCQWPMGIDAIDNDYIKFKIGIDNSQDIDSTIENFKNLCSIKNILINRITPLNFDNNIIDRLSIREDYSYFLCFAKIPDSITDLYCWEDIELANTINITI